MKKKIVIIGGTGLIGRKLIEILRTAGHEAVPASPSTGVNTLTGEGLAAALTGADVLVDVSNSPSFAEPDVTNFFETSTRNIVAAAKAAGTGHVAILSIVGVDRLPGSGYFRAKVLQEKLLAEAGIPYSILRATQFFEFVGAIAGSTAEGDQYRASAGGLQPVAADDVAAALADVVLTDPVNGFVELGGPEKRSLADFVRQHLQANGDSRPVIADPAAGYFGAPLGDSTLTPDGGARLGKITYADWLARH